jgi:hypothetical protein
VDATDADILRQLTKDLDHFPGHAVVVRNQKAGHFACNISRNVYGDFRAIILIKFSFPSDLLPFHLFSFNGHGQATCGFFCDYLLHL